MSRLFGSRGWRIKFGRFVDEFPMTIFDFGNVCIMWPFRILGLFAGDKVQMADRSRKRAAGETNGDEFPPRKKAYEVIDDFLFSHKFSSCLSINEFY